MPQDGIETIETIAWLPAPRNGQQNVFPIGVLPIVGSTKNLAAVAAWDAASGVQAAAEVAAEDPPELSATAAAPSKQQTSRSRSRVRITPWIARPASVVNGATRHDPSEPPCGTALPTLIIHENGTDLESMGSNAPGQDQPSDFANGAHEVDLGL
jgi:hypothetical protein